MLISLFLIVVALVLLRIRGHSRWLVWVLLAAILILTVLSGLQIGLGQITGEGVNGAVFYHLRTGLAGGDISQYGWVIAAGLLAPTVIAGGLWRARRWIRPGSNTVARGWDAGIALLIFAAIAIHPVPVASAAYALRFSLVAQQVDGFHDPLLDPYGPESPRNLVIVYLESLERTYLDETRFPGLTPYLSALEKRAITFTDLGQTTGATFTMGGMVATQCGVPLILSGGGGNAMRVTQFLSGATCLGDILNEAGYTLSYMGGASIEFAGKGAFHQSHGFSEITGRDELVGLLDDPNYLTEWGLQDDTLFDLARVRFNRLAASDRPFVLSLLTLDTHPPYGHAATNRGCAGMQYGDGNNPNLNAVLCDDYLAGHFIEEILSGPYAENTVIAVMSDHLAMGNTATDQLNAGSRRNLLMILDPTTASAPRSVDRPATTLDTGPTLLSYLGFDMQKMGLGVNLMGAAPTIPEQLAVAADESRVLDAHVMGYQSVYTRLWAFPDISDGLYVNLERGEANYGHSAFPLPTLLAFDSDYTITEISLSNDPAFNTSLTQLVMNLPEGTPYMWFDDCQALGVLRPNEGLEERRELCLASGQRGVSATARPMPRSTFLSQEELAAMLSPLENSQSVPETEALTRIGLLRADLPQEIAYPGLLTGERGVLLQSSAFGAGSSLVRRQTTDTLDRGQDWLLGRGIHLVGITANGEAELLDRMDQCTPGFTADDHRLWADQIAESHGRFVAHAIIVQDTAYCGRASDKIAPALDGLELPVLRKLEARQAYIGVFDNTGAVREFDNAAFPRVRLLLTPSGNSTVASPPASVETSELVAPMAPATTVMTVATAVVSRPQPAITAALPVGPRIEPDLAACNSPEARAEPMPIDPFPRATRIAGEELTGPLGFGRGWWNQEQAGRWSGAHEVEFTLILPETDEGLTLRLDLASAESRTVALLYDGAKLAELTTLGDVSLAAELGILPRGTPVTLLLSIGDPDLTCPALRGLGNDRRQMGVMLKAVTLEDSDGPTALQTSPATIPEVLPMVSSPATRLEGCIGPKDGPAPRIGLNPLPLSRVVAVPEAESAAFMGFGAGWWSPEPFGRWMGNQEAEFTLVLPASPNTLSLALSVSAFGGEVLDLVLTHDGQQIGRHRTQVNYPFRVDVSALPRGRELRMTLSLPGKTLGCPATHDGASDQRSLGLMLQSVRLDPNRTAPFGSSIALGGGQLGNLVATNSFDALEANIGRFEVFELDFDWTADGELVCIDDWQRSFEAQFGALISTPPDYELFRQLLAARPDAPRNCDLDGLAGWLRANNGIRIVTDVTKNTVAANTLIAELHPNLRAQFIPQAIFPEDINALRDLGFEQVIWAPDSDLPVDTIINEIRKRAPTALSLKLDAARGGALQAINTGTGLPVYLRASNDPAEVACYIAEGAAGFFSDNLGADQINDMKNLATPCPAWYPATTSATAPFTMSIGHGGGRLDGVDKTDSYDALDANIHRFEVFELDFEWTADGELVCIHDWDISYTSRFDTPTENPPDYATFQRLLASSPGAPRNCDLNGLADWMRAHPDIRIVTDVKSNTVAAHELIVERHPDLLAQFVPQAYNLDEIDHYRKLGFQQVIWTLYKSLYKYRDGGDSQAVIRDALDHAPNAITMPYANAEAGLMAAVIEGTGLPVYVHTINNSRTTACLLAAGAAGIYSDDLGHAEVEALAKADVDCN